MGTVQMELLTTREFVAAGFTAAIIPLGACESHGDHMPMGTDGFTAHALAVRIAEQLEVGRARAITGIDCAREGDLVTLWLRAHGDIDVAMWSARQEAPVFKRATGHRLAVERA